MGTCSCCGEVRGIVSSPILSWSSSLLLCIQPRPLGGAEKAMHREGCEVAVLGHTQSSLGSPAHSPLTREQAAEAPRAELGRTQVPPSGFCPCSLPLAFGVGVSVLTSMEGKLRLGGVKGLLQGLQLACGTAGDQTLPARGRGGPWVRKRFVGLG